LEGRNRRRFPSFRKDAKNCVSKFVKTSLREFKSRIEKMSLCFFPDLYYYKEAKRHGLSAAFAAAAGVSVFPDENTTAGARVRRCRGPVFPGGDRFRRRRTEARAERARPRPFL